MSNKTQTTEKSGEEDIDVCSKWIESNRERLKKSLKWSSFVVRKRRTFDFLRDGVVMLCADNDDDSIQDMGFVHDRGHVMVSKTKYCVGFLDTKVGKLLTTKGDIAKCFVAPEKVSADDATSFVLDLARGHEPSSTMITSETFSMFGPKGDPIADKPRFESPGVFRMDYQTHVGMRGPVFESLIVKFPTVKKPQRFEAPFVRILGESGDDKATDDENDDDDTGAPSRQLRDMKLMGPPEPRRR